MQKIKNDSKTFRSHILVLILTMVFTIGCIFSVSVPKASADDSYKSWKQTDPAWGSMTLSGRGITVAKYGCAVTALSMMCVHSGAVSSENFNPGVLVNFLKEDGAFTSDGSIIWSKISDFTPNITYKMNNNNRYSSEQSVINTMSGYLSSGYYVLIRVNNNGSTHFVTLDYMTDSDIFIMDPGKKDATNLFDTYGYYNITGVRLFNVTTGDSSTLITDGTVPEDPTAPVEEIDGKLDSISSSANLVLNNSGDVISSNTSDYLAGKYSTIAALNLREEGNIDSDVLMTIPKNAQLNVVLTTIDGWGKVTYNKKTGWVCLRYVK